MWKSVVIILIVFGYIECDPCSEFESLNITTGVLNDDGSMEYNGIVFKSDEWYKVYDESGAMSVMGCPCLKRVCLWKCCEEGSMLMNKTCSATDEVEVHPFSPPVFKGLETTSVVAENHFFYMHLRDIPCDERYRVDTHLDGYDIYIQENATLIEVVSGRTQWHAPTSYCVDIMATLPTLPNRLVALVCLPPIADADDSYGLYIAYAVGLLISLPFLLATFLVYAFISELRNLHGMCLMAYCGGLIVAYPILAYLKIDILGSMTSCMVLAFIIYFAFQTSFFWLNIMCFDIWRTFSGYRSGSTNKSREIRRFFIYGIYAWGVPLLLTAGTMAIQFTSYSALPANFIRPNFGHTRCWFEDWRSELVYFFTPVLVLVVCNVVLFSITAHRIRSIHQETAILKSSESSRSDKLKKDKQRYALYLKLFMVMGVNWTVELISFAAGGSNWYWVLTDLANISLGIFIFLIFVWKSKVRSLVRKKFSSWRGNTSADAPYGDSNSKWATRSSSAPTEMTRVSTDDAAIRMNNLR